MTMHKRATLILSGGMDSAVALYYLRNNGYTVDCLHFDYGQRHRCEFNSAHRLAELTKSNFGLIAVPQNIWRSELRTEPLFKGSSQTDNAVEVPKGHYADPTMRKTVVPNRNMVMLALATSYCISNGIRALCYAAHSGDHAVYPDCRPQFAAAMQAAIELATYPDEQIELLTPFIDITKAELCAIGDALRVPFEDTYSCYEGAALHCGKCGTCVERREAFLMSGVGDPTRYATD